MNTFSQTICPKRFQSVNKLTSRIPIWKVSKVTCHLGILITSIPSNENKFEVEWLGRYLSKFVTRKAHIETACSLNISHLIMTLVYILTYKGYFRYCALHLYYFEADYFVELIFFIFSRVYKTRYCDIETNDVVNFDICNREKARLRYFV